MPLPSVPDGVPIGAEVQRAARVLPAFKDLGYGTVAPEAGFLRRRARCLQPLPLLVGSGIQDAIGRQLICDLCRPPALHAHPEDPPDHGCRLRVDDPMLRISGILHVAVGHIGGQRGSLLTLRFGDRPDLPAGVLREELVEPVADAGHVVVHAELVGGVETIVDGDIPDAVLREGVGGVQADHGGVAAQPGEVLREQDAHMARPDLRQHLLKAGPVEAGAAVAVVHEEGRVGEAVFPGVLEQDLLLVLNGQGFAHPLILLGEPAVECCDLCP